MPSWLKDSIALDLANKSRAGPQPCQGTPGISACSSFLPADGAARPSDRLRRRAEDPGPTLAASKTRDRGSRHTRRGRALKRQAEKIRSAIRSRGGRRMGWPLKTDRERMTLVVAALRQKRRSGRASVRSSTLSRIFTGKTTLAGC